jgi:autotransporter-associated beta strand protein
MKPQRQSLRPSAFAVAALMAAMSSAASAQTNGTWTTTTPTGDSGNWSDSTKWASGNIANAGGNATFGAYANNRSVALDANYTVGTLTIVPRTTGFSNTTFALTGTNTLTINSGLIIGGGTSVSIAPNLVIGANQTWTTQNETGVATVAINGTVSGTGQITRTANGANTTDSIITFVGNNTFSGGFTQNAARNVTRIGTSSVVSGGVITTGPLGTGTITLNGGTLSSNANSGAGDRTLHNNIVVAGPVTFGSSSNGALTFSDAGLATASTFTLGSATNGAVNVIRTANTALNIDQVIAESGGVGQSVLFSSTSGTPTVTLNKTKTATGNLLTSGVNLVLANGAANSGSIIAVNGAVTATGANKFSTGALVSDGAGLVATDASNYSEILGGQATVYNNGRVSFASDQTQATIAGLFTEDSQVRLGLGSGSASTTVTENYDQSAIGNGLAGLVSASTGTITYTGTLTAGSDDTYRVGGGLGTLALGSALTGSNNLRVEGGGNVTSTVNHTYTGSTTLTGSSGFGGSSALSNVVTLSGSNGGLSGTSGVTLNSGATLNLEMGASNVRINDTASVTLNSGYLLFNNAASTAAFSETIGNLVVNAGANQINFRTTPAASTIRTVQFGTITRNNNALLLVRGDALGGTATARNEIKFTNSPTLIGGGGAAGTTNQSIVPWMRGAFNGEIASGPGRFVTYDSNGLRTLNPGTEMVQANATTQINTAIGANTDRNVRWNPNAAGNANLLSTAGTFTVNSLWIGNATNNSFNTVTYSLNTGTINVTSGVVHFQHDGTSNLTIGSGTLAFGNAEAVISSNSAGGFLSTIGTTLTGSGGLSIYALNGGGISLGSTANNISGTFTFGGNGFIAVDNDTRFGNASNSLVHGGGELRFFTGFTSTRAINLLGDVGDNTLGNNATSGAVVWNGDISGAGRLRLINNAITASTNGFSLGGNNTYSGGTQIEGIAVTAASNNAFGTGTVTLLAANGNGATVNVTAADASFGGLRGADGTVTINPTGTSATLTVGSNNENTAYSGVIAQGSGKTGSFTKTGTGNFVFGGLATYTGATTISDGTYTLAGSIASSAVTVQSEAKLALVGGRALGGITTNSGADLVGSGTIGGASTFNGNLAIGSSPGVLTLADAASLTFGASSVSTFEFTSASFGDDSFDRVVGTAGGASETVTFGGTLNLVFSGTGYTIGDNVAQIFNVNSFVGSFDNVNVSGLDPLLTATFDSSTGFISITAIPEPSAFAALAGLGALGLAGLRRRRRA